MAHMELTVRLPVIGVVRTSRREPETTPIQASLNRAERGTIEIAEPYRDGLDLGQHRSVITDAKLESGTPKVFARNQGSEVTAVIRRPK